MGVKKAHDAAMAIAIRKVSGFMCKFSASFIPIGAITMVVAVLFSMSDKVIVKIINKLIISHGSRPMQKFVNASTISEVVPLVSKAAPRGIIAVSYTHLTLPTKA